MPSSQQPIRIPLERNYPPLTPECRVPEAMTNNNAVDSINPPDGYYDDPRSDFIYLGPLADTMNGCQGFGPLIWSSTCSSLSELRDLMLKSGKDMKNLPEIMEYEEIPSYEDTVALNSSMDEFMDFLRGWLGEMIGEDVEDWKLNEYILEMQYDALDQNRERRSGESDEDWEDRADYILHVLREKGMFDGDMEAWLEEPAAWENVEEDEVESEMDEEEEEDDEETKRHWVDPRADEGWIIQPGRGYRGPVDGESDSEDDL